MIVSKETQSAVMELIGECFKMNRRLDRMVSVLGVKFAYNNTANLVHHGIAHYYPVLADGIGEKCLERYNIPVVYAPTPAGDKEYNTVQEIIQELENINIEFQTLMMGCCKIAFENNDIHVYVDLLDMLEDVNEIVEQAILLNDKMKYYNGEIAYDHNIHKFWILKEDE